MTNTFIKELENIYNTKNTENSALAYKSTLSKVYDMFAFGGAYRNRSDEDVIKLFKEAYDENPELALKCLFYLRDIRGVGQGERRFFKICFHWLAKEHPEVAKELFNYIPFYGRVDDLYCLVDTPIEEEMFIFLRAMVKKAIKEYCND